MELLLEESIKLDSEVKEKMEVFTALEEYRVKIERFGMSKDTAIALEQLSPGLVTGIGLEKFTELPSGTKQNVALEAIDWKRAGVVGAILIAIATLAYKIASWIYKQFFGGSSSGGGGGGSITTNVTIKAIGQGTTDNILKLAEYEYEKTIASNSRTLIDYPHLSDVYTRIRQADTEIGTMVYYIIFKEIVLHVLKNKKSIWTKDNWNRFITSADFATTAAYHNPMAKHLVDSFMFVGALIYDSQIPVRLIYRNTNESMLGAFRQSYVTGIIALANGIRMPMSGLIRAKYELNRTAKELDETGHVEKWKYGIPDHSVENLQKIYESIEELYENTKRNPSFISMENPVVTKGRNTTLNTKVKLTLHDSLTSLYQQLEKLNDNILYFSFNPDNVARYRLVKSPDSDPDRWNELISSIANNDLKDKSDIIASQHDMLKVANADLREYAVEQKMQAEGAELLRKNSLLDTYMKHRVTLPGRRDNLMVSYDDLSLLVINLTRDVLVHLAKYMSARDMLNKDYDTFSIRTKGNKDTADERWLDLLIRA